jgi:hypothetical protein
MANESNGWASISLDWIRQEGMITREALKRTETVIHWVSNSETEKSIKGIRLPTFNELFSKCEGFKPNEIVVLPRGSSRPSSGVLLLGTRQETEYERQHHVENDGKGGP